jgi:hypothetical protein
MAKIRPAQSIKTQLSITEEVLIKTRKKAYGLSLINQRKPFITS